MYRYKAAAISSLPGHEDTRRAAGRDPRATPQPHRPSQSPHQPPPHQPPPHKQPAQGRRGRGLQPSPTPQHRTARHHISQQPSGRGNAGCKLLAPPPAKEELGPGTIFPATPRKFFERPGSYLHLLAYWRDLCGPPPKKSVGAPDQMTVSQHSKSEGPEMSTSEASAIWALKKKSCVTVPLTTVLTNDYA